MYSINSPSPTQLMKKPLKFTILSGVKYIIKLKITKQIKFQSLKWDVTNELPLPYTIYEAPDLRFTILSGVKYILKLKITNQIKFQSLKWDITNEFPLPYTINEEAPGL